MAINSTFTSNLTEFQSVLKQVKMVRSHGLKFYLSSKENKYYSYQEFYQQILQVGAALQAQGCQKGDRVIVHVLDQHQAIQSVCACFLFGFVAVPIVAMNSSESISFKEQIQHIINNSQAAFLVSDLPQSSVFVEFQKIFSSVRFLTVDSLLATTTFIPLEDLQLPQVLPEDLAFLQYTSGSTSHPKGVMIRHSELMHNLEQIRKTTQVVPGQTGVSWLPIYHDMGLIGCYLSFIYNRMSAVFIPTNLFVRRPYIWMQIMSDEKASFSAAPNFGFRLATKYIQRGNLNNLDLSHIARIFCGAEPIDPLVIQEFLKVFGSFGLKPSAIAPSYGMAEATLLVTVTPLNSPLKTQYFSSSSLQPKQVITTLGFEKELNAFDDIAQVAANSAGVNITLLVGCGQPAPGLLLKIVPEAQEKNYEAVYTYEENHFEQNSSEIGEIWIKGPNVTTGYYKNIQANQGAFVEQSGWLKTGDLGFFYNSQLYVCGRKKDIIFINGANFFPQDIEFAVAKIDWIRDNGVVCVAINETPHSQLEGLGVVVESRPTSFTRDQQIEEIKKIVYDHFRLVPQQVVILLPPEKLFRTSSGKLQRNKNKVHFQ